MYMYIHVQTTCRQWSEIHAWHVIVRLHVRVLYIEVKAMQKETKFKHTPQDCTTFNIKTWLMRVGRKRRLGKPMCRKICITGLHHKYHQPGRCGTAPSAS